jgi:hypothetical protein
MVLITLEFTPGKKTWIARITGVGGKFGLEREFCGSAQRPNQHVASKVSYCLGDGIHEVCEQDERSFVLIRGDRLTKVPKEWALAQLGASAVAAEPLSPEELVELAELKARQIEREKLQKLRRAESRARQKELDDEIEKKMLGLGGPVKFTSEGGFDVIPEPKDNDDIIPF